MSCSSLSTSIPTVQGGPAAMGRPGDAPPSETRQAQGFQRLMNSRRHRLAAPPETASPPADMPSRGVGRHADSRSRPSHPTLDGLASELETQEESRCEPATCGSSEPTRHSFEAPLAAPPPSPGASSASATQASPPAEVHQQLARPLSSGLDTLHRFELLGSSGANLLSGLLIQRTAQGAMSIGLATAQAPTAPLRRALPQLQDRLQARQVTVRWIDAAEPDQD